MAKMTGFKVFNGTKAAFEAKASQYADAIVFISGGTDSKGSCIYAQGMYFGNFAEFLATVNYVKGISVGGQSYNAAANGGYVAFGASDPSTVEVNVGRNGVQIGLTEAFVTKVNNTADDLGTKADAANSEGSAFARIANLAQLVKDLTGGSVDSIEGQITKAVNELRTEIVGTLDTDDSKTLQSINDEIDTLVDNYNDLLDAGYITISDVQSEIAKLEGSDNAGENVKVSVASKGGKITDVTVDESGLNTALAGKANLDASGKILASELPDYILGQVMFGGIISVASAASIGVQPTDNFREKYNLTGATISISRTDFSKYEGVYFIAGGSLENTSAVGVEGVNVGDWIISTGSEWAKVDNTDAVASVAGLTGAVSATALAKALAETGDANELALKSEVDAVEVSASGDNTLLAASVSNKRSISVAPTTKLTNAVAKAESAYQKPSTGIAKSDLASEVQTSLGKADTAYQKPSTGITTDDLARNVQDVISLAFTSSDIKSLSPKYITVEDESEENTVNARISAEVKPVASAVSDDTDGLASSKDVKAYVDAMWEWEVIS